MVIRQTETGLSPAVDKKYTGRLRNVVIRVMLKIENFQKRLLYLFRKFHYIDA